jgi:hypothetical protein
VKRLAALAAAILLCALVPAAARADVIADADEQELTQTLAEAQEEQGICYAYLVTVNGATTDSGSSTGGPGQALDRARCPQFAQLRADLTYTCDSCEGEDSASYEIATNLADPPTIDDLRRLGYDDGDLLGDRDDQSIVDMTLALALLASEKGAPVIPFATVTDVPSGDVPTDHPSSDFLRKNWYVLVLCAFVILLGPAYWLYARLKRSMPL